MENQGINPFLNYFRQPAIYLILPSNGRWWPPGSIELSNNNEVAIYPMSTRDEILLRTPDALMNGQGIVDVIQSCCPAVKNAWHMPAIDTDAMLIAIRIASYGPNMDFESKCTHCGHNNQHSIDLGAVLSRITCSDYAEEARYKDLKIKFRPLNYQNINKNNMSEYSEQKIISLLNDSTITPEARQTEITALIKRIHQLSIDTCVNSTDYIELSDGTQVDNLDYIREFYSNSSADLIKLMQDNITKFSELSRLQPHTLQCESCTETYQATVSFDYSNFFGSGS
jgi:hypothetical protein